MLSRKIFLGLSILLVGNIWASEPEASEAKVLRQEEARAAIVSDLIALGGEIGTRVVQIEAERGAWLERFAHQNNKAYRLREVIKASKLVGSSVSAVFNSLCSQNFDLQNLLYDIDCEIDLILDRTAKEPLIVRPINDEFEDNVKSLRKKRIDLMNEFVEHSALSAEKKIAFLERELALLVDIFGQQSLVINQLEKQLDPVEVKKIEQQNIDLKNSLVIALETRETMKAIRASFLYSAPAVFTKLALDEQDLDGLASGIGSVGGVKGVACLNAVGSKIAMADLSDDQIIFLSATPESEKVYYVLMLVKTDLVDDSKTEKILSQTDYPITIFACESGLLIVPDHFNKDSVIRYVKYDQDLMLDIAITTDLRVGQDTTLVTDIGVVFADEIPTLTLNGGTVLCGKCSIVQPMGDFMQAIRDQAASWGCTF